MEIKKAKLIRYFRRWNYWRKRNMNGRLYHILVLFGIAKSPTFAQVLLPEDIAWDDVLKILKGDNE